MIRLPHALGSLCAVLGLLSACARPVSGDETPQLASSGKFSDKAEAAINARKEAIQKEAAELAGHPWAGEYYYGDGLGVNVGLAVAPKSGFAFEWRGCMGLYDRNYGDVTVTETGAIELRFTFPNDQAGFQGVAPELTPIRWGERHYLAPENQMIDFCNAVNSASEPRNVSRGLFFLRVGDETRPAVGLPAVPAKYQDYLLKEPLHATITGVEDPLRQVPEKPGDPAPGVTVRLRVDRPELVREGMAFYPALFAFDCLDVQVTRVEGDQITACVRRLLADKSPPESELIGAKLATSRGWLATKDPSAGKPAGPK